MATIPFFRHRLRCIVRAFLVLNLVLTVVRQVFDLMGYVWTPITANFLNIVFTIFAIFAAAQFRRKFFIVYGVWTPFWLSWNSFLICYYFNVGSLDRADLRYLSWGTGGESWWNRHTPGCQRTYNATSATVQIGDCKYLRPYFVEIIEAAAHLFFTGLILILIVIFLLNFPRKIAGEPYSSLPKRRSTTNRPHVTVEINPTPSSTSNNLLANNCNTAAGTNAADISFGRSSDLSSGYLNASYDVSPAVQKASVAAPPALIDKPQVPQPLQNYRRSSQKRRSSSGSVQRRTRERSRERIQNGHTNDGGSLDQRLPIARPVEDNSAPRSRSNSTSSKPDPQPGLDTVENIRTSMSRQSQRLSHPVQGLGDILPKSTSQNSQPGPLDSHSESPTQPEASRPNRHLQPGGPTSNHRLQPGVPTSNHHLQPAGGRRQPIIRPVHKRDLAGDSSANVVDYSNEPRRIGGSSTVGNEQQQSSEPFQSSNPLRRSVISFDPKSDSDTLLRFHDHLGRSQETIRSRASTSTQPHNQSYHRNLSAAPDGISFDSGLPPSQEGVSEDDPRLSRDLPHSSTSTGQQRQPIGYEPAFMMSYEPASSQDEPIYRPSFLKSGNSTRSPAKFRYESGQKNFSRLPTAEASHGKEPLSTDQQRIFNAGNDRTRNLNGHGGVADIVSNEGSGSETSSVTGLAVPRISNASLLV